MEKEWQRIETKMGQAASILLDQQNELGITPPIAIKAEKVTDGRHHINYDFGGIGRKIAKNIEQPLKSVMENKVFWLHERSLILWSDEVGKWSLLLQK